MATSRSNDRANIPPLEAWAGLGMQVNGSFDVSQENGTSLLSAVADGRYPLDCYLFGYSASSHVFSLQQVAPPGSPSFGAAFQNCLQIKATTGAAISAAQYVFLSHRIEGYRFARCGFGNAAAQSVSIGFWVYATIAGTLTVRCRNSASDRMYLKDVVVNNALTWEFKTVTIPGDTTGTWLFTNGIGAQIEFALACGSNNYGTNGVWQAGVPLGTSATTNFFATTNNVVCITGLVVLPNIDLTAMNQTLLALRSPLLMRSFDVELDLCMRYYQKSYPQGVNVPTNSSGIGYAYAFLAGVTVGNGSNYGYVTFSKRMRTAPAITPYSYVNSTVNCCSDSQTGADAAANSCVYTNASDRGFEVYNNSGAGLAPSGAIWHWKADARL